METEIIYICCEKVVGLSFKS